MANSLRAKLSKLRHDGNITDDEYKKLVAKLDGHDKEIRAKAIDEFAEKLLEEVEANPVDVGGRYSYMIPQSFLEGQIKDIAEQLKEE